MQRCLEVFEKQLCWVFLVQLSLYVFYHLSFLIDFKLSLSLFDSILPIFFQLFIKLWNHNLTIDLRDSIRLQLVRSRSAPLTLRIDSLEVTEVKSVKHLLIISVDNLLLILIIVNIVIVHPLHLLLSLHCVFDSLFDFPILDVFLQIDIRWKNSSIFSFPHIFNCVFIELFLILFIVFYGHVFFSLVKDISSQDGLEHWVVFLWSLHVWAWEELFLKFVDVVLPGCIFFVSRSASYTFVWQESPDSWSLVRLNNIESV